MRSVRLVLALAAVAALGAPAVHAESENSVIRSFIANRINSNAAREIPCPPLAADCASPTCTRILTSGGPRCFELNDKLPYWDALRWAPDGGDVTISECGPYVAAVSFFTWSGDQTGNAGDVQAKFRGIKYTATINGVPVPVLTGGASTWKYFINVESHRGVGSRSLARFCDWHMTERTADCPKELQVDPGESCWGQTWGVDLSHLPAGEHVLVSTIEIPNGFPGVCPATQPTCKADGTQQFSDNGACTLVQRRKFIVTAPGGCE